MSLEKVYGLQISDPLTGDSYNLSWSYEGTDNAGFQYFAVERSVQPDSGFTLLTNTTFNYYFDSGAKQYQTKTYYYRIKPVVTGVTTSYITSRAYNVSSTAFLNRNIILARLQDLQWIINKGGFAQKAILLKRKVAGVVCATDSLRRRGHNRNKTYAQNPHTKCTTCYGTGFVGGYEQFGGIGRDAGYIDIEDGSGFTSNYDQYNLQLNISRTNPQVLNLMMRDEGQIKKRDEEWWMLGYPRLSDGDILVIQNNQRYRVKDKTNSDPINGYILWQSFNLIEIQETDIEYRYVVS